MNVAVDVTKIPAPITERGPGYWSGVFRRLSRDKVAMTA